MNETQPLQKQDLARLEGLLAQILAVLKAINERQLEAHADAQGLR